MPILSLAGQRFYRPSSSTPSRHHASQRTTVVPFIILACMRLLSLGSLRSRHRHHLWFVRFHVLERCAKVRGLILANPTISVPTRCERVSLSVVRTLVTPSCGPLVFSSSSVDASMQASIRSPMRSKDGRVLVYLRWRQTFVCSSILLTAVPLFRCPPRLTSSEAEPSFALFEWGPGIVGHAQGREHAVGEAPLLRPSHGLHHPATRLHQTLQSKASALAANASSVHLWTLHPHGYLSAPMPPALFVTWAASMSGVPSRT